MVEYTDLVIGTDYWYVFIPTHSINSQVTKIEKIQLEKIVEDGIKFRIYYDDYLTVSSVLEKDRLNQIFQINDLDSAKKMWAKEIFQGFTQTYGIDFSEFITLYKKIQIEHPEWII